MFNTDITPGPWSVENVPIKSIYEKDIGHSVFYKTQNDLDAILAVPEFIEVYKSARKYFGCDEVNKNMYHMELLKSFRNLEKRHENVKT